MTIARCQLNMPSFLPPFRGRFKNLKSLDKREAWGQTPDVKRKIEASLIGLGILAWTALPAAAEPRVGTLYVHVVDEHGLPVPNVSVDLLSASALPWRAVRPDDALSLPPGEYRLQAAGALDGQVLTERSLSYPLTVKIAEGDMTSVVLPLKPVGANLLAAALINSAWAPLR
jgi:hypothetical protein